MILLFSNAIVWLIAIATAYLIASVVAHEARAFRARRAGAATAAARRRSERAVAR
ncbi:hypothetical protein [Nocardia cyriacigeorgica]|uniref:hypothetical protein n=1 Tax=Nocardia cyriacigeorgica TaxID=135487 RepID=UPI002454A033|nr:hypothetical protein [Nocardia cyriacigeorgica]